MKTFSLLLRSALLATPLALGAAPAFDVHLPATAKTVVMTGYSAATPPALRIRSGQTVRVDTLNSTELNRDDYARVLATAKIPPETPYIKETLALIENAPSGQAGPGRLLTGPIYVEDAEPGDTLEVRVLDLEVLSDFAINRTVSNMGHPLATITPEPTARVYAIDRAKGRIQFSSNLSLPLAPFLGEMGIAPAPEDGLTGSNFPTKLTGGSFDCPDLGQGATLYFPVQASGALFQAGAGKAVGANGKVNSYGMEVPMTAYLQFIVHKGKAIPAVRAETSGHYITFGTAAMLDVAMRFTCLEMVDFLKESKGLDFFNAYCLGSLAIDFNIPRTTQNTKVISAIIPKYIFTGETRPAYWYDGKMLPKYYLPGSYFAQAK